METMTNYREYILEARHDSRSSFYNKARVIIDGDKLTLRSYSTDVAWIQGDTAVVRNTYSATTLRHIKEFLRQNGFKAETAKQILNDYQG